MNLNKVKYIGLIAGVSMLVFTGCKKDFFDINESPNSPKTLKLGEILPTAELAIGQAIGNDLKIAGGMWAQYWGQNFNASQYKAYDKYNISAEDQRAAWNLLYTDALTDLNRIIEQATTEAKPNYVAVATILKAYDFQVLTDAYGDIPFSEAGKGAEGTYSPKYDSQKDVYDGIIAMLKDGISKIDVTSTVTPGSDDLIYGGNMDHWKKFGNTLLLKVYMRLSNVDNAKAQAGIKELEAAHAVFLDNVTTTSNMTKATSETAKIDYFTTGGNTNPLYASFVALGNTRNLVANLTALKGFIGLSDPRVFSFYTPTTPGGNTFVGIPNGYLGIDNTGGFPKPPTALSYPGPVTGADPDAAAATAPVVLLSDYESNFLQAEAVERGWMVAGGAPADAIYDWAIQCSFASLDLYADSGDPASDYSVYVAQAGVDYAGQSDKLQAIYFQKWYAMCGIQNFESWTEGRRTGYIESNMGNFGSGKFFSRSLTAGSNQLPARMLYPLTEVTRNAKFPGQKMLSDKLWWAK
jgi:hypothetical protein